MKIGKRNIFSFITIILIIVVYSLQITNMSRYSKPKSVIAWDVRSYYAYLPAVFIEKDHKMQFNLWDESGDMIYWPATAPNGGHVIKTSMGMAVMYAPFFFVAHSVAEKMGYEANGFTTPYAFALMLSCVFYVFIGFIFLRWVLLRYFKDIIVAITLIIIGLATNLHWYVYMEAPMSHGYSFALFCVFLYLIEKWQEKQDWDTTIFMGLLIGLITLVRPTNGVVVILFLLYNITNLKDIRTRAQLFLKNYGKIIVMIVCILIIWLPQLLYWKSVTGNWFYYSYGSNERFFFNHPQILSVLFSFRKGWLIYTPVMIFALIGVGMLWKTNKKYFYPTVLFLIINLYVVSSWWCWWYGGSFGMRALIESYAILAIPLATFLTWVAKQKLRTKIPLFVFVGVVAVLSFFHTLRYHYGTIHWDSMTTESYFKYFLDPKGDNDFGSFLSKPDYKAARAGKKEGSEN
jgi:hypothetical protein